MDVDVLVVGAGPAGLAAAVALRRHRVGRVLVVEREQTAGGIPRHTRHVGFGMRDMRRVLSGPRYAARYVRLAQEAGVNIETETSVLAVDGTSAAITSPRGMAEVHARAVLLATGCRERPRAARLVPGDRPAGVHTTGSLQQAVYLHGHRVGTRAVIVGAEHVSFSAIATLAHAGVRTAALVTEHARHQTYAPLAGATAVWRRVPVLRHSRVVEIVGRGRVEAVVVEHASTGAVRRLACDTVVFTGDWIPDHELARAAGLDMERPTGSPRVDTLLRTSARGVFAAGNLVHAAEAGDVAALSGRHAGAAVAAYLAGAPWPSAVQPIGVEAPVSWVSPAAAVAGAGAAPRGRFVLRVSEFCAGRLEVVQGERTLWRGRHVRLTPARSLSVPDGWLREVAPDGGLIRVRVG